jgi:hypothetical protein
MQTLNQLPEEGQKAIARSLGYMGKKDGFPAYLMSNPSVAQEYTAMENAFRKQQEFTQMNKKPQMAEGGYMMDRFEQNQQQDMVGGYVPPPQQSFAVGGNVQTQVAQPTSMPALDRRGGAGGYGQLPNIPQQDFGLFPNEIIGGPANLLYPSQSNNPTVFATSTNPNIKQQEFKDVVKPVYDENYYLQDGTTINPNYGKPVVDASGNPVTQTVKPNIGDITAQMMTNPGLPTGAEVQTVGTVAQSNQMIGQGTGQVGGNVALPTALAAQATSQGTQQTGTNIVDPRTTQGQVEGVLAQGQAAQGTVSAEGQVTAAQGTSSVGQLNAAQGTASAMSNPVQRQIQAGELISGAANAETASKFTEQIQAATATPSEKATVQGQLASLTANFDASNPPAWAAGTLRGIQAQMAARGLGASSMAGQAMIQGALESALPIAQADANIQAQFETQNLSNRQQRAMLAAQQRAQFIGQEFDQAFQSRVQNAARIGDIANMNFTAEQNIALENSRAVNTMNLNNLNNKQAMVMAEASALANMDMSNLNNRQQSAVQNAQSFLQMDMANLSNTQQSNMFKAQQRVQSMFTDQAAENAAKQFNATSQNQTDQFFASLGEQTNQFNATQINAQQQFNAGQVNTVERFNAELNNQRDQFNAQNQMVIAQSNANWRRQIATEATAATNRANELNAQNVLGLSNQAYNNLWQYYGDTMEWAWTSAENERSRVIELAKSQLAADSAYDISKLKNDYNSSTGFGKLIGTFLTAGKSSVAGSLLGGIF